MTTASPSLAICIPTYNFGDFIGATLDGILDQAWPGLEIVVLDGGSTDNTADAVQSRAGRHAGLRYVRQDHRGGIDRDMARVVELAQADYCWLFSADDLMLPGALKRAREAIASGEDVYLAGFTLATRDMQALRQHPVTRLHAAASFELADSHQRQAYMEQALTTVAFFSFMGSLIVRRARWNAVALDERFVGSCWAHVARLFALMPQGLRVRWLGESLMLKRSDNDSFMDRGIVHRLAITVDGYHRLAETFFAPSSSEARHIRRVVRAEYGPYALLYIRMQAADSGVADMARLDALARRIYADAGPAGRIRLLLYRLTPLPLFRLLRGTWRLLRRLRNAGSAGATT
jgi:abequosyltransferase